MKAAFYHADARYCDGNEVGNTYQRLIQRFNDNCHAFGLSTVHLTLDGFPQYGDENHTYGGFDPAHVVANREECFSAFLKDAPDDVYWFTEPDCVIYEMWPALKTDCAMLYRNDAVRMCPAWRMARPSAYPFFERLRDAMRDDPRKDWHGDSAAFTSVWKQMGGPTEEKTIKFLGVDIEFRQYWQYVKPGKYSRNFLGPLGKKKLLEGKSALATG